MSTSSCRNCVFVGLGAKCPECGAVNKEMPNWAEHTAVTGRLYGGAAGVYYPALGKEIHGKDDLRRELQSRGLRQMDPGERSATVQEKREKVRGQARKEWEQTFAPKLADL